MGSLLLVKKGQERISINRSLGVFEKMGLSASQTFSIGNWNIWSWGKILSDEPHFVKKEAALLICTGTPVYKGTANFGESLQAIFSDLQHNCFNYLNIRGTFSLLYSPDGEQLKLYTDQAGISNLYFDLEKNIISSSFLAVIFGLEKKVTLNKFAATEVITSGRQIGPDTLFNEINRLEISLEKNIEDIEVMRDMDLQHFPDPKPQSFSDAVDEQVEAIDQFFEDIKDFGNFYGVDSGLTAGHDSRMVLIELSKKIKHFQVHSFWRKSKDLELSVAEKVAQKAGISLKIVEGKHQLDKTDSQLEETLNKSLFFYDGHIRMHCFLMEDYHTVEHRVKILGDKKLGMNGIGGEQYRNEWHMEQPSWRSAYFVKYCLAYHISGRSFTDPKFEQQYFHYLQNKLFRKLDLTSSPRRLSKKYIKKYYNEIYVASLLGVRTHAENVLGHFITPFIDRQLTRTSYHSLPHQGISYHFQQAMIRRMDPALADVTSGYGYSFTVGEPWKNRIKYLIKEFTPTGIYQQKLDKKFALAGNRDFRTYMEKYPLFASAVGCLRGYGLPLDEKMITSRPDIMPVYLSLAYFLFYLQQQERLEKP